MAAVQKRRSSNRVKTQRPAKLAAKETKGPWKPKDWVRDVISLAFLSAGILLALSLGSHFYSIATGRAFGPATNVMGPTGHIVATLLEGVLGLASILPVAALVWLAFFRPSGKADEPPRRYALWVMLSAGVCCVSFIAALLSLSGWNSRGGQVGTAVSGLLERGLGGSGALLAITLLIAVSGAIVTQRSVGDVAVALRWGVQQLVVVLCVKGLQLLWAGAAVVARASWRGVARTGKVVGRTLFARSSPTTATPERKPQLVLDTPRPKVRKNIFPVELEQPVPARGAAQVQEVETRAVPIIVKPKQLEALPQLGKKVSGKREQKSGAEAEPAPGGAPQFTDYVPPDLQLLSHEEVSELGEDDEELRQKAEQIESKLRDFNIAGRVTQVHPGPVITLFEFEPAPGVKVGRIAALQDDLSMSLKASSIRIIAPIPKRGTVGIEVPNKHRATVRLRDCLESEAFISADSTLSVPLGKDTYGDAVVVDIATMPHLLMAGATGTGKSVCINALLLSLLYRAHPSELGLILIDPKVLELSIYDGIPHLRVPVVTDPRQAKAVLTWAVKEMDRRYRYMQRFGVRNIDGYNQVVRGEPVVPQQSGVGPKPEQVEIDFNDKESALSASDEGGSATTPVESVAPEQLQPLPKIVIVIDELADLMLTVGREIEDLITRLAQKARAAGIHLIVATQRPSVDVITGLIKANFPARLSFRVSSRIDSRTILDAMGAEKLLGKGDMLFMLPGAVPLKRVHGAFVSDQEVQRVVQALKSQCAPSYDDAIVAACEKALTEEGADTGDGSGNGEGAMEDELDPFYDKAVELVVEKGQASTSMIQRAFRIGYNRAARIIEMMEREGVVSKMDGVRPREILAPAIDRTTPN